jgi:uncharacterized OB-fold protein
MLVIYTYRWQDYSLMAIEPRRGEGVSREHGERADAARRPFPEPPGPMFADHFDGLARGRLVIRQCAGCGARQWPPRALCGRCRAGEFRPLVITDTGVVHTFTVVHRAFDPWFAGRVPYGIVVADLGDGIRITGNYAGGDLGALACGLPVQARFERSGGRAFLCWAPR